MRKTLLLNHQWCIARIMFSSKKRAKKRKLQRPEPESGSGWAGYSDSNNGWDAYIEDKCKGMDISLVNIVNFEVDWESEIRKKNNACNQAYRAFRQRTTLQFARYLLKYIIEDFIMHPDGYVDNDDLADRGNSNNKETRGK